jgi:CHAT domain-containing protein
MEALYERLGEGLTKGAALRYAQQQLLETEGESDPYVHPYFWAPFCLVGDAGTL